MWIEQIETTGRGVTIQPNWPLENFNGTSPFEVSIIVDGVFVLNC